MKIVFLQENSFLLTPRKTNPYFDPLIRICEDHHLPWEVWYREKGISSGYASNHIHKYTIRDTLVTAGYLFFARIIHLSDDLAYQCTRVVLSFLRLLPRDICLFITSGLSYVEQATILYPGVAVVDVQHGIIYSSHPGYFNADGFLLERYAKRLNLHFWLYGKGYQACFEQHEIDKRCLKERIEIVGDIKRKRLDIDWQYGGKKHVVIASQLVKGYEFSPQDLYRLKMLYENAMDGIFGVGDDLKYTVLFRHHPRFLDCIDLTDWKEKYPLLVMNDERNWDEIYPDTRFVLTLNSTSAFDAAAYGVPTVILDGKSVGFRNILVDDFSYPCSGLTVEECLRMDEKGYQNVQKKVHAWYRKYYEPYDPEKCWEMLKKLLPRGAGKGRCMVCRNV